MTLDLYKTIRMVEEEIVAMKQQQQAVISTYQQQTREDIAKKFEEADHALLQAAEQKIKEINSLEAGRPYLITSAKKVAYISVRRIRDESEALVEIEPIIYPTAYNLKFVLKEPSVALYSPSKTEGTFSVNAATPIRATDLLEPLDVYEVDQYADLWVNHTTSDSFAAKLRSMGEKIRGAEDSSEILVESLLMMSSPAPRRELIYFCEEHDREPTHLHDRTAPPSSVKGLLRHHLKLN